MFGSTCRAATSSSSNASGKDRPASWRPSSRNACKTSLTLSARLAFSTLTDFDTQRTRRPSWRLLLTSHGGCRGSRGSAVPARHVRRGSVAELADQLRTLPLELEGVDRVAAAAIAVGYGLEQAAKQAAKHARTSRRIADIIAKTDQEKDRAAALRIGCLVLFNALAFQDRLAASNEDVPTVNEALGQGIAGLRNAWRSICDNIDYVPVFELAGSIMDVLLDGPDEVQSPVIVPLVKAMEDTRRLEGHDLSGRLFHTLLTDREVHGRLLHVRARCDATRAARVQQLAAAR